MNPDETVNWKIFKFNNKEMWHGKDSSFIEFNKSNTVSRLATCYHDKHTIWKLLYGYCAYVNDNSTHPFEQST